MRRLWMILAALLIALAQAGCATSRSTASADPTMQWERIKTLHVKKLEGENSGLHNRIAERFRSAGYSVTADPQAPAQPDAIVTYVDRWMWDITMYMLELTIVIREPASGFPLASGNALYTSLVRKSEQEMIDEVVGNILKQRK
jgi:hypothetical protein